MTNSQLRKICRRGGAKIMMKPVYEEMREIIKIYLEQVIGKAVILANYDQTKTIIEEYIIKGIKYTGYETYARMDNFSHDEVSFNQRSELISNQPNSGSTSGQLAGGKSKFRDLSGSLPLKQMRILQGSDAPILHQSAFKRLVREISQDFKYDLHFTDTAVKQLQVFVEDALVKLVSTAVLIITTSGCRIILSPKDVHLAFKIRTENHCI
jgi:histone H3/H4